MRRVDAVAVNKTDALLSLSREQLLRTCILNYKKVKAAIRNGVNIKVKQVVQCPPSPRPPRTACGQYLQCTWLFHCLTATASPKDTPYSVVSQIVAALQEEVSPF